ncbi:hypothetical protein BJV74DRAFT_795642 [Russula compacta]|nr:hypothetical protein BJV74DRAFT_795642 [Russula compacta]
MERGEDGAGMLNGSTFAGIKIARVAIQNVLYEGQQILYCRGSWWHKREMRQGKRGKGGQVNTKGQMVKEDKDKWERGRRNDSGCMSNTDLRPNPTRILQSRVRGDRVRLVRVGEVVYVEPLIQRMSGFQSGWGSTRDAGEGSWDGHERQHEGDEVMRAKAG